MFKLDCLTPHYQIFFTVYQTNCLLKNIWLPQWWLQRRLQQRRLPQRPIPQWRLPRRLSQRRLPYWRLPRRQLQRLLHLLLRTPLQLPTQCYSKVNNLSFNRKLIRSTIYIGKNSCNIKVVTRVPKIGPFTLFVLWFKMGKLLLFALARNMRSN